VVNRKKKSKQIKKVERKDQNKKSGTNNNKDLKKSGTERSKQKKWNE
jgi:hypothetical protein